MTDFNSTDISVRLEKAKCCAGVLADKVAKEFAYGLNSAECNLTTLKLLNTYIEILCEYQALNDEAEESSGRIAILAGTGSPQIRARVNGQAISNYKTWTGAKETTAAALATDINNFTNNTRYTATDNGDGSITLTADTAGSLPNGYPVTLDTLLGGGTLTYSTTAFSGGSDEIIDGDNCISEEQMQLMFEQINRICRTCSASPNTTYITT